MRVQPSVKKICRNSKIIRRNRVVRSNLYMTHVTNNVKAKKLVFLTLDFVV